MADPVCQTPAEERLNVITHGLGAALSAAGLAVLVTLASIHGDARRVVTVALFGASLVLMYVASTCFHACPAVRRRLKRALRIFDHSAIYILIAGTYTPFLLVLVRGGWGWSLFGVLWGLALAGTCLKLFFVHRFEILSTLLYVLLGWIGVIGFEPVFLRMPADALVWIFAGGAAYTLGVVFFIWERLRFSHAVWHGFVLAGSACHFIAVLRHVALPPPA